MGKIVKLGVYEEPVENIIEFRAAFVEMYYYIIVNIYPNFNK